MTEIEHRANVLKELSIAVSQVKTARGRKPQPMELLELDMRLEDVGIDSISVAEVVDLLEQKFDAILPFENLLLAESVGEFVDTICAKQTA